MDIFGYFDNPIQTKPARDPGLTAPCPVCTEPVGEVAIKTISLIAHPDDGRSYFFRAHKDCWKNASEDEQSHIESLLIDNRID